MEQAGPVKERVVMQAELEADEKVRRHGKRLYAGELLTGVEMTWLLHELDRPLDTNLANYVLSALAASKMQGAEDMLAKLVATSPFLDVAAHALRELCGMGLSKKYRSHIVQMLQCPLLSVEEANIRESVLVCIGYFLRDHKDKEFADILRQLILQGAAPRPAAIDDAGLGIVVRLSAVLAVGGDTGRSSEDSAYEDEQIARFLSERELG